MEDLGEKRLQDIQMADLGTARREYVSTADRPHRFNNVSLREIEAARLSNRDDSIRRLAERNKTQLSAWANLHRQTGDIGHLESLDAMMGGQSHRAHLNARIKESGGQEYTDSSTTKDNFLRATERVRGQYIPVRGHGGGSIRRGRVTPGSAIQFPSRISSQGSVSKPGAFGTDKARNKPFGPAVQPEKGDDTRSKDRKNPRLSPVRQPKPVRPSGIKTRAPITPIPNYESLLPDPESFLAAVRSRRVREGQGSVREIQGSGSDFNNATQMGSHAQSPDKHTQRNKDLPGVDSPLTNTSAASLAIQKPSPASNDAGTRDYSVEQSDSLSPESRDSDTGCPKRIHHHGATQPTGRTQHDKEHDGGNEKSRVLKLATNSNLPQPQLCKQPLPALLEAKPQRKTNKKDDLLLDFSSSSSVAATPNYARPKTPKDPMVASPSMRDLMELDFNNTPKTPFRKPFIAERTLAHDTAPGSGHVSKEMTLANQASSHTDAGPATDEDAIFNFHNEISLINDTLATFSATGFNAAILRDRKRDLEARITQFSNAKLAQKAQFNWQLEEAIEATNALTITSERDEVSVQTEYQSIDPEHAAEKQNTERDGKARAVTSMKRDSSPRKQSPLQQAVTAPPFVPTFAGHGSSTSVPPVRSQETAFRQQSHLQSHVSEGHFLPKSGGGHQSTSTIAPVTLQPNRSRGATLSDPIQGVENRTAFSTDHRLRILPDVQISSLFPRIPVDAVSGNQAASGALVTLPLTVDYSKAPLPVVGRQYEAKEAFMKPGLPHTMSKTSDLRQSIHATPGSSLKDSIHAVAGGRPPIRASTVAPSIAQPARDRSLHSSKHAVNKPPR